MWKILLAFYFKNNIELSRYLQFNFIENPQLIIIKFPRQIQWLFIYPEKMAIYPEKMAIYLS